MIVTTPAQRRAALLAHAEQAARKSAECYRLAQEADGAERKHLIDRGAEYGWRAAGWRQLAARERAELMA